MGKKEKNIYRGGNDLNATYNWKDLYTLYYLLYMKSQFLFFTIRYFPFVFSILFILLAALGMQILLYDVLLFSWS